MVNFWLWNFSFSKKIYKSSSQNKVRICLKCVMWKCDQLSPLLSQTWKIFIRFDSEKYILEKVVHTQRQRQRQRQFTSAAGKAMQSLTGSIYTDFNGAVRYSCGHISSPRDPIPTIFWAVDVFHLAPPIHGIQTSEMQQKNSVFCDVIASVLYNDFTDKKQNGCC